MLGSGLSTPKWPIFFTPTLVSVIFRSRSQRRVLLPLGFAKGAEKAIAVDIDDAYLQMVPEVKTHLEFHDLDIVKANVANQNDPADIVLAAALVHWIYSCTALFGCHDAIVEKLARLTNYMPIVEWIDLEDSNIGFFHHTDWNKDAVSAPYDLSTFEQALTNNFKRYCYLGNISPTRRLYVRFQSRKVRRSWAPHLA